MLDVLEPLSEEHGWPLRIQHVSFVEGRGNIIVEYPGTDPEAGVVSFVGAHMVRCLWVQFTGSRSMLSGCGGHTGHGSTAY